MIINKAIICAFLLFLPTLGLALKPAATELSQLLSGISSMQASFEQFSVNKIGDSKDGQHIYGTMAFSKPGKFRWQTHGDTKQLIIASNDRVWIYDADLEQATKHKIDYHDPSNPAMLLAGDADSLQTTFDISTLKMPGVGKWFELRPKVRNSTYEWIRLHFIDNKLIAMYIADNLGQHSEIRFEKIEINISLASSLFNFTPPKGTDVINDY
jgi:outer membrane lipoprotein carrier protein